MANGFEAVMKRKDSAGVVGKLGSRRIFAPQFKLQVLESYRRDADCRGNQRATARKYGIHRRQIQKWLQAEQSLRAGLARRAAAPPEPERAPSPAPMDSERLCEGPVDLTVARRQSPEPSCLPLRASPCFASPSYPSSSCESCEAWDLSRQPPPAPTPVKLFRPYLLDEEDRTERRPSAFEAVQPRGGCAFDFAVQPLSPCSDAVFQSKFRVHKWLQQSVLQRAG